MSCTPDAFQLGVLLDTFPKHILNKHKRWPFRALVRDSIVKFHKLRRQLNGKNISIVSAVTAAPVVDLDARQRKRKYAAIMDDVNPATGDARW